MADTLGAGARWNAAAQLADGAMDDKLRVRRRRALTWMTVLVIVSTVIGLLSAFWPLPEVGESGTADESGRIDGNQVVVQLIFGLVGATVMVGGFIWALLTGRYITRWRAVSSPFNWNERKSVRRQIMGKEPVEPSRLPILISVAQQNQRVTEALLPIYSGVLLLNVPVAVGADDAFSRYCSVGVALSMIVVGALFSADYRRTDAFLQSHYLPGSQSSQLAGERSDSE